LLKVTTVSLKGKARNNLKVKIEERPARAAQVFDLGFAYQTRQAF